MGILTDEGPVHVLPPAVEVDSFKVDVLAWVRGIASNDAWWKETTIGFHVLESDVTNIDEGLSLTGFERIGHATWTLATGLLLLLWPNVNSKPNRIVDLDVLICDVFDFSSSIVSWVSLHINGFHWEGEVHVFEMDSSDTVMSHIG